MRTLIGFGRRHCLWLALVPLLAFALACGAAEETATTPTTQAPVAVPTPTALPTPTPTPVGGVPKRGGQLIQYSPYPSHWDQTQLCCPDALIGLTKTYLTVLWQPTQDTIECDLCKSWSLENGGKTIALNLRGDATFHNGTPIKAKDIKYSIEKIMGKIDGVVNIRNGFIKEYIETIDAPDDLTVKINMKRPAPLVSAALTVPMAAILPEGTKRAELTEPPVGPNNKYTSGPFYLKEAVRDSHYIYERYPNYFKKGLPYLDSIKMQHFADQAAATTALLVGQVGMFTYLGTPPPQFWPQLNKAEKAGKISVVDKPYYCLSGASWMNQTKPPFDDIRVRQAFDLAIDRVEYGQVKYGGDYIAATYFPADTFWGRPASEIWDVIPGYGTGAKKKAEKEAAKKLLADAGYPNGMDLKLLYAGGTWTAGDDEVLQRNLRAVGVRAELDLQSDASNRWAQLNYQFYLFRACLAIGDPDELVANYYIKGGGRNFQGYTNPKVEDLYILMSSEQDPAKRKQFYRQIEDILIADVASLRAVDGTYKWWYDSKLRGFTFDSTGNTLYRVATNRGEGWWLSQ